MGGRLKLTVREQMAYHSGTPINTVPELLGLLEQHTSHKVYSFGKEDVARIKATLPPRPGSLHGALLIHEISVSREGRVQAKKLTSDLTFFPVNMVANFTPAPLPAGRLEVPTVGWWWSRGTI